MELVGDPADEAPSGRTDCTDPIAAEQRSAPISMTVDIAGGLPREHNRAVSAYIGGFEPVRRGHQIAAVTFRKAGWSTAYDRTATAAPLAALEGEEFDVLQVGRRSEW